MLTNSLTNVQAGHQGMTFENLLQRSVTCGILVVDPEGKILALTPEAERALGMGNRQKTVVFLEELPASVQSTIEEVQTTGRTIVDRPVTPYVKNSGAAPAMLTAVPWSREANPTGVIVVVKEFSSGDRVGQNLRQLDRLASVGTMSASMAHEIKNAIVAIKTFTDLLLEKNQDAELAGVVRRELGRVDSIVSHMLKFVAPAQPMLAPVRLHDLLEHALRLVRHRVKKSQITFVQELKASQDMLNGDAHHLEQAFVNLLFNAVEAMKSDGTLTVGTDLITDDAPGQMREGARTAARLRIRITDTGDGIPPEDMNHIFEPFFTTKQVGTGLGLAITRRIIAEHGGSIHAESLPGKGTTFVVLLPLAQTA